MHPLFWRLEIIIILRRDTARSKVVSIKKWRPQNGIGDGGDARQGHRLLRRGASGIWRSASPGDLLRSVVGAAPPSGLFVVCPPLLGEILTNVFALGRASGARNEDEPLRGGRRVVP